MKNEILLPVRHGLIMAVIALISGALWAGFLATQHTSLHVGFESQLVSNQAAIEQAKSMPHGHMEHDGGHMHAIESQHSHTGSLTKDAMQRLLRGHIHFMGLGVLAAALLLVTAFTSLAPLWKKVLGWSFGIGALAYPPAWILMGFRTVALGPEAAEASVMWLFAPAVGLLLLSMGVVLAVLLIEWINWQHRAPFSRFFSD
jgi:hypothetical protein